ncbi:MAG: AraC family transcriptional regulator [bacterium]
MDVLSDVLNTVRLRSAIQFCTELTAPWGFSVPAAQGSGGAQNDHATFYVVARGSCYLEIEGHKAPVSLVGGDFVMLVHGNAHILRDHPDSPAVPLERLAKKFHRHDACHAFHHGGGGSLTTLVAGSFTFENPASKPFLATLPALIHIQGERGQLVPWLETTLKWMAAETTSNNPGAHIMASRLTDILFIQILRAHIAEHAGSVGGCEEKAGWLRALADANIGKALELVHEQPDHPWTVAELASRVNMSRTSFSLRFAQLSGMPPLSYVTKWRMLKAGDLLHQDAATISEIAAAVGYESEASFSKAFKREMGVAPGTYRKEERNGVAIGVPPSGRTHASIKE